jgi:hypothetical protein
MWDWWINIQDNLVLKGPDYDLNQVPYSENTEYSTMSHKKNSCIYNYAFITGKLPVPGWDRPCTEPSPC